MSMEFMRAIRCALASSVAVGAITIGIPVKAQAEFPAKLPVSEICPNSVPSPCPASTGTRTVTLLTTPSTVNNGNNTTSLTLKAQVDFDGSLFVNGTTSVTSDVPFFSPGYLASLKSNFDIQGSGSYIANVDLLTNFSWSPPLQLAGLGFTYENQTVDIRRLGISYNNVDTFDADGNTIRFSLNSVDPDAITDNGTALAGTYSQTEGGAIVFGRLGGSASVRPSSGSVQLDLGFGNNPIVAPYTMDLAITSTELTRLDETGLITPAITVTDGIEMNGSKITGLADGTAPTDAVNKRQLDGEAGARAAADVALQSNIDAEVDLRTSEDTAIRGAITAEAGLRSAADLQLTQRIATEESARAALGTALTNETAARIAADQALSTQLNGLGTRVGALEARVGKLDQKIDGSTAVAVAMGGATFLPDTKFNLTANVGTYGGAQAGSFQVGALVSSHVAINAGVAKGFNKSGKTAGRAGVTFGW